MIMIAIIINIISLAIYIIITNNYHYTYRRGKRGRRRMRKMQLILSVPRSH